MRREDDYRTSITAGVWNSSKMLLPHCRHCSPVAVPIAIATATAESPTPPPSPLHRLLPCRPYSPPAPVSWWLLPAHPRHSLRSSESTSLVSPAHFCVPTYRSCFSPMFAHNVPSVCLRFIRFCTSSSAASASFSFSPAAFTTFSSVSLLPSNAFS